MKAENAHSAVINRQTNETIIALSLALDSTDRSEINTGVGFLDHMLDLLAKHGGMALKLHVQGDLAVDAHHTVEDVGICLGQALKIALGDKLGIERYGHVLLPMDETLVLVALDLSGRAYLAYDLPLPRPDTEETWRGIVGGGHRTPPGPAAPDPPGREARGEAGGTALLTRGQSAVRPSGVNKG
jgi:imidazoleglycerol phosphate dehydratase HisB